MMRAMERRSALGEDLGDRSILDHHAVEAGIDTAAMHVALDDGSAYAYLDRSEALARGLGVRGTPAWFIAGRLVVGLRPREQFEQLVRDADASIGRDVVRKSR
jgi:predicted DsbA family dithiol-disulfide isomerase